MLEVKFEKFVWINDFIFGRIGYNIFIFNMNIYLEELFVKF